MRVHAEGRGPVHLRQRDFVAQGGEGTLYAKDGLVYKVWLDPSRAPSRDRLQTLGALKVPRAALPEGVLTDDAGTVVGYVMRHLADHVPLARLATRTYRERHGIGPDRAIALVTTLAEGLTEIHRQGGLVVDLSELNVLVDPDHREPWWVDVASWQLPGHPATAVAEHVRDRRAPPGHFDTGTDWFSFAIVAFQVLVGIHPYRGRHPQDFEQRARTGIITWHPDVAVPTGAVWPQQSIPSAWQRWLTAVLTTADRFPPPLDGVGAIAWTPTTLTAAPGPIRTEVLLEANLPIRFAAQGRGRVVAVTATRVWVDGHPAAPLHDIEAVAFGPRAGTPVAASRQGGRLALWDARTGTAIPTQLAAEALTTVDGRLIVKSAGSLVEVELHELRGAAATRVVAAPRRLAEILPHATTLFDGCALQDVLGRAWLSLFPGPGAHRRLRVPELDGRRVLSAHAGDGAALLTVVGASGPEGWLLRFDRGDHTDLRRLDDDPVTLDLCVPCTGVAVLRRGGTLELMRARPGDRRVRTVTAPILDEALRLVALGDRVGAICGPQLSALRLSAPEATSSSRSTPRTPDDPRAAGPHRPR